jgi:hypothetical protein
MIDVEKIHSYGGLPDPNLAGSGIANGRLGDLKHFDAANSSHPNHASHLNLLIRER